MNSKHLKVLLSSLFLLSLLSFANAASIPKGTYTVKTPDGAIWELNLDGAGKFKVTKDGSEVVLGKYKVIKDEIEFADEKGLYAEKGDAQTGTYKWKLTKDKLEFTNVNDKADGRSSVLTSGLWEMKK